MHPDVYIPKLLYTKLEYIKKFPLSIVEAPSGFGKTTALREFLRKETDDATSKLWYTCLGESDSRSWQSICDVIAQMDAQISSELSRIDVSKFDILKDAVHVLKNLKCPTETYFIVDNFQMLSENVSRFLLYFFSNFTIANLHTILLTQQLEIDQQHLFYDHRINTIDTQYFTFDKECISRYFRLSGIRLQESDLESIHNSAAGWVSAVRLHLINYREKGCFVETRDVWELIEYSIWNKLSEDEKCFFMGISIFENFSTVQAFEMANHFGLRDHFKRHIRESIFVTYLPDVQVYTIHAIFQEFLRHRLYKLSSANFQTKLLRYAGDICLEMSDYQQAITLLLIIEDYETLLKLTLRNDYFNYEFERYVMDGIETLVWKCPVETLKQYPLALITIAFQFLLFGKYEVFAYLHTCINDIINNPQGLEQRELEVIQGELAFVESFTVFNRVECMVNQYVKAYALLKGASRFNLVSESWTFGSVSVLYMFWSESQALMTSVKALEEGFPHYAKLSRGHGAGGDVVFRAEVLFNQGHDIDAEALCHKALYIARTKNQVSICICAEFLIARIAVLRGDVEAYQTAVSSILQYKASHKNNWQVHRMVELCLATLVVTLGLDEDLPDWIEQIENYNHELYSALVPYGQMIYGKNLLLSGRYTVLYGLASPFIETAEHAGFALPKLYHLIHLAAAKKAQGKDQESSDYLSRAFSIAMEDGVYMPFAEHASFVKPYIESGVYPSALQSKMNLILSLCKRQEAGSKAIKKVLQKSKVSLTARELEVALLARGGDAVKEIAHKLFVSDATVKTILKNVYRKLDIHSKIELNKIEL